MGERTCGRCTGASRRGVLAAAAAFILDIATAGARAEPADERPKTGDLLVRVDGGAALTPADIVADAPPPIRPAATASRTRSGLTSRSCARSTPASSPARIC